MMKEVFVVSDNILSPLGGTTAENFMRLRDGQSGIRLHEDPALAPEPFYGSLFKNNDFFLNGKQTRGFTRFEQLLAASLSDALVGSQIDPDDPSTILILSSTKGNISLLDEQDPYWKEVQSKPEDLKNRVALPTSARLLADYFHFRIQPLLVSHACISGLLAIITGMRLLQSGQYEHAVIMGADCISKFILSGFQSFQAVSPLPCKPFDVKRDGISLGEAAGTLILSTKPRPGPGQITVAGAAVTNDANHISGPSRTGKELFQAISRAMRDAAVSAGDIDYISAHGTATLYNDEMEAKAVTLASLQSVPLNSMKGYYGHTLGAAGLIESIISVHSLLENLVLATAGFSEPGTSQKVNVCGTMRSGTLRNCLKIASGFGGCNAALVLKKG